MNGPHRFPLVRAAAAAALSCVLLASCATVPVTGPVVPGDGGGSPADPYDGYVRLLPAGPQPGVGPEALVDGFLRDMGSFEENYEAARSYMLEDTGEEWTPDGTVQVFGDPGTVSLEPEVAADGLTATVRMRTRLVATIDESGRYLPSDQGTLLDVSFGLAREGGDPEGEWRVRSLPEQLILSRLDVERTHRSFNLYYYNRELTTLVPDPVYLPVSNDNLAERLLRQLFEGPTAWSEPAVTTTLPEGASLTLNVDEESARVRIGGVPEIEEFGVGAQIAWTLRQLPEIQEFTVVLNGEEIAYPRAEGESAYRPRPGSDHWSGVAPGGTDPEVGAYYMQEGQIWSTPQPTADTFDTAQPVPGPLGAGDIRLERFAVSLAEDTVAGVTAGGDSVVTSEVEAGADAVEVLSDGVFTSLSWDVDDNLWVVEELEEGTEPEEPGEDGGTDVVEGADEDVPAPGGTALWMLRGGDEVVGVDLSELEDRSVIDAAVSRDGTRIAALTELDGRRSLEVGRVVVDGDGQVTVDAFLPLAGELADVTDFAWRSSDQLVALGSREGGTSQAFLVSVDGGTPPTGAGAPVGGMETVAAAPGQPLIAGAEDGNVWISDRLNWQIVAEGVLPTYPG
ncbi:LpqB family beta-propeller domain-containing protein [Nocardiopsis sp. LOL_012]|uniref:LpqB family beta-propeller domain-containing protein n=1 Tax=Nocardiopsis sp. LOL_012 TaxID=3345409 RepID=UPI003A8B0084